MTTITRQRLIYDTGWSVASSVIVTVFGFGYFIIVGNKWGSSGLGVFSLSMTIYLIGSLLFNVGIHNAVLYEVASSGEEKEHTASFVYTALFSSFVLGSIGGATGFVFAPWLEAIFKKPDMANMVSLFALALPMFLVNKTALGILNAHRRMRLIAGVNILRGAIILIYLISAVIFNAGLGSIPYGFILAEVLIAILLLMSCFRTHEFNLPSVRKAGRLISFGWKAALSGVIGDINAYLDILVIGFFWEDASVVGVYTLASRMAKGLWLIPAAFQRVTNPLIVQLYSSGEKDKLYRTMDVLLRLGTSLFVFIGTAIAVYIKPLIVLCFPHRPDMLDAVIPLYFLLPGVVLFAGITMLGAAPSTSINKPENAVKIISTIFSVNLVMNFVLVPHFAAVGAASATTVSLLAGMVCYTFFCRKYLGFTVPMVKLFIVFTSVCSITLLTVQLESVLWRPFILIVELIIGTAILVFLKMIQKNDLAMMKTIAKGC